MTFKTEKHRASPSYVPVATSQVYKLFKSQNTNKGRKQVFIKGQTISE